MNAGAPESLSKIDHIFEWPLVDPRATDINQSLFDMF